MNRFKFRAVSKMKLQSFPIHALSRKTEIKRMRYTKKKNENGKLRIQEPSLPVRSLIIAPKRCNAVQIDSSLLIQGKIFIIAFNTYLYPAKILTSVDFPAPAHVNKK